MHPKYLLKKFFEMQKDIESDVAFGFQTGWRWELKPEGKYIVVFVWSHLTI